MFSYGILRANRCMAGRRIASWYRFRGRPCALICWWCRPSAAGPARCLLAVPDQLAQPAAPHDPHLALRAIAALAAIASLVMMRNTRWPPRWTAG